MIDNWVLNACSATLQGKLKDREIYQLLRYKTHKQQWRVILNTKTANGIKIIHQVHVRTLYMYLDLHTASNSSKMMRWRPLLSANWKIKGKDKSTMTEKTTRKIACSMLSDKWRKTREDISAWSGKRWRRRRKEVRRPSSPQFPPVLYSWSRILNFTYPTPGTGYKKKRTFSS